jgi:hypothetical protein
MTKDQIELLAHLDEVNAEFADCTDGIRRGELQDRYQELIRRSDVVDALAARTHEQRAKTLRELYAGHHGPVRDEVERQLAQAKANTKAALEEGTMSGGGG